MYIPSDAPHVANAHKFLEYLMQPQVMADVSDYINYANSNAAATPLLNASVRNNPAIYPDADVRQRLFPQKTQDAKDMRAMTRVWSTVKSGI
jgi:putrescine transport system substrate-binding protein